MAIGSRLGQQAGQRQALGLTPALQQSIKLLQLSGPALAELLAEAVAENPLLEWAQAPPPPVRTPPVCACPGLTVSSVVPRAEMRSFTAF